MITNVGVDPISNPLAFIFLSFFYSFFEEGIKALFEISIISSVIAYPFILLGDRIKVNIEESKKWKPIVNLFVTTLVTLFIFWVIIRVWYVIFSGSSFMTSIPDFIIFIIGGSIIMFFFVILGNYIKTKISETWKMPQPIAFYIVGLIICIVFWLVVLAIVSIISPAVPPLPPY